MAKRYDNITEIDVIEHIEKYNEYHDPATGRFASKGGSSGGAIGAKMGTKALNEAENGTKVIDANGNVYTKGKGDLPWKNGEDKFSSYYLANVSEVGGVRLYNESSGSKATKPAGGATISGAGIEASSKKEWAKNAQKKYKELEKLEDKYNKLGDDMDKAFEEVRTARRNGDAKGEARAQKKVDTLSEKARAMEDKVWEARSQWNDIENYAYENGINLA